VLEQGLAGFRNSNTAGIGFGENFSDHRTICLMKLMASTRLSSAIARQYSSVLPVLCNYLSVFHEICGMAIEIKIAN